MQNVDPATLTAGQTVWAVMSRNAVGQPIRPIRAADWRKVTITADNLETYRSGNYMITTR